MHDRFTQRCENCKHFHAGEDTRRIPLLMCTEDEDGPATVVEPDHCCPAWEVRAEP